MLGVVPVQYVIFAWLSFWWHATVHPSRWEEISERICLCSSFSPSLSVYFGSVFICPTNKPSRNLSDALFLFLSFSLPLSLYLSPSLSLLLSLNFFFYFSLPLSFLIPFSPSLSHFHSPSLSSLTLLSLPLPLSVLLDLILGSFPTKKRWILIIPAMYDAQLQTTTKVLY